MKVKLENVTKKYGQTFAVNDFSAELPDGHLICLLGPSGCGKSTLLNMLCGIIPITQGHIFFDKKEVSNLPPDKRNIGMVFQNYALYPHLTVLENIAFPLEVKKIPKKERIEQAKKIASLVHVDNLLKRFPAELSGGQQQRVAIARAIIKKPELLLMDEPLSNLDARLRLEMREEIRRIQKETGITTIFVTHDQEEAMAISDSILLMKNGNLIQSGLCQNLYANPDCRFVAEFLGNPPINQLKLQNEELKLIFSEINLPENKFLDEKKDVVLEIRPESFVLGGKFESQIVAISEMGKDRIITLNFFNHTVRAVFNNDDELQIGKKINVGLKQKGVFVFDEKTGVRLI